MRALITLLALAAIAGATAALPSDNCTSALPDATRIIQVTDGTPGGTVYIDERADVGVYVYLESNGIWTQKPAGVHVGDPTHADLQRGGIHCDFIPCETDALADPCWDDRSFEAGPDTQIG